MQKWLAYAQLVRLPNAFTAMADIFLAGAVTGAILDQFGSWIFTLLASVCLYCSGMVWNDYFDLRQDMRERPFRPIASGRVSLREALRLGCLLVALGVGCAAIADIVGQRPWFTVTIAVLLTAMIFLYDGVLKHNWLGAYAMGACRFLNILMGLSSSGQMIPAWGYLLALSVGVYIVGVTWFARTEARLSKKQTLLTAALVMAGGVALGLTVPALALETDPDVVPSAAFPFLLAAFGLYVSHKVIPAIQSPRPDRVQPAVKRAVLGLVLLDAILATSLVGVPGLAIVLLLAPAQILGKWLYST